MSVHTVEPSRASLRATATRAFGWSFLNTALARLGTLAVGVVLANLLGPAELGAFAVAMVALLAALTVNEVGVSLAIVRWTDDPRTIAPTVTTIAVATSCVVAGVTWCAAPAFATAMGAPEATLVVRLMGLAVLIDGVVAVPAALLQRSFQARRRMVADQANTWLGAAVSLVLVLLGFGALSLAIGRIVGCLASGVLLVAWSPLPFRFGFDPEVAARLLRFGLPLAGAGMITMASGYADQIVTGTQLGPTALGMYVLAFNLASWPVSIFSQPLRSVAPAAFARLQHDPMKMQAGFAMIIGLLAAVAFPACAVLAGASDAVVSLVYRDVWAPAAGVLTWLGIAAALRIVFELTYDYLVVRGASRAILFSQATWLVVSIPLLLLGTRMLGLDGVAIAHLTVAAVILAPLYGVLLRRAGLSITPVLASLRLPIAVAVLVGLFSRLVVIGLGAGQRHDTVVTNLWACVLAGVVGLLGIAALLWRRRADLSVLREDR